MSETFWDGMNRSLEEAINDETYQADKSGNTHDELHNRLSDVTEQQLFDALRAVVELHKPDEFNHCGVCNQYLCETIQAIEKELG